MDNLFAWCPQAVRNAGEIAARCAPALPDDTDRLPSFPLPEGQPPGAFLRRLVYQGARERYRYLTPAIRERLEKELGVIIRLGYAGYFLVVWDVVRYAREHGIRCAGRGSAGASAVAYCLRIDSRYRDRVAAYVYAKYGEEHVAAVATYSTYQARSAVREMGKVLGYPAEEIDALAKSIPPIPADQIPTALERFPELRRGPWREERYRRLFAFCARIAGFPRFLGTHLGGLVICRDPVTEVSPLEMAAKGVRICQFDRDDVEDLHLVKLDLLSLKALSVLEDAGSSIAATRAGFRYERLPLDDAATYRRLNRGETLGVFQLESPAQRALQARLQAENIEDLVASLALIRPGPIKGNMVDPFVARRQGLEPVCFSDRNWCH